MHERLPGPEGGVENRGVVRGGGGGRGFQHLSRDLANVNVLENNV